MNRLGVVSCVVFTTFLVGLTPSHADPARITREGLSLVSLAAIPSAPVQPKPFSLPAAPIVAASSDGYLPSSWTVSPKGEFTMTLPLAVPPGRAGMAPALSLDYSSRVGNGVAGVGWSVSGFSTITRGGRNWTRDGATDGVDYTPRDRFYLDGEELVGVNATPYGGNGAEYRTEPDSFVRVHSASAQPLDPKGPESFAVELGDGRTRTYAAHEGEQVTFADDNTSFTHAPVRVEWRLVAERDAHGNTISYDYADSAGPGGASVADYWIESVPASIRYTANLTNGQPTHGARDLPQRTVVFEYEPRSDASSGWNAGVQRRHSVRLKSVRMEAPNPVVPGPVWHYDLTYSSAGSQRSLLQSVRRCENAGGCLWAKQFAYSPSTTGASFATQPLVPAPIPAASYDLAQTAAPDGEAPALQTLDLNGDGASDVLFGAGANELWEKTYAPSPFDVWLPDGKFLGGAHDLWLSQRDAAGAIVPLGQAVTLARDEEPLASASYGHVRLDEAAAVDLDGDGRDELVAAIDNLGAHELNNDPNLPPLYGCSFATLAWTGAGFTHEAVTPCTAIGTIGSYTYYLPNEFPQFADFDGDALPDRATSYNTAGWTGSNNPGDEVTYEFSPAWKIALNETAHPGLFAPPVAHDAFEASAGIVTDLDGDGRAELTSEALKTSLGRNDEGQWARATPDSVHMPEGANNEPRAGYREFGDFNGDGTEDLMRLTRVDPTRPGTLTVEIFWNTGKGFYADPHVRTIEVDVHTDSVKGLATRFADPGIHVTDLDNDGRMDLVVFNNDHRNANDQPAPQIEFLFSGGDGTFAEVDMPVQAGTRDDVKYWLDNALRPITFYPGRLEHDQARLAFRVLGQVFPPALILLQAIPYQDYFVIGGDDKTPGLAAGWNLATLTDANGDGAIDIIRHVGGNAASGGFEVLQQTPHDGDELVSVSDEAAAWPVLSIDYSSEWSDRPEVNDSYTCTYPLRCPKSGLRVVRGVTSRSALTDLSINDDPLSLGHTWEFAYRDPIAHAHLGFFGFGEMNVWDAAPEHPVETITTFDLRTPGAGGKVYPGVGVPATVTIAQPILQPGAGIPASAPARITKTTNTYELRTLNGGATHAVLAVAAQVSEWEESVAVDMSGQGPDHHHVSGYQEPASPPIHLETQRTCDDFGKVTATVTAKTKGLATTIATPRINDTVNWHLGLVDTESVTTLESVKGATPFTRSTAFSYTSAGDVETIDVEPNSADTSLQSTTSFAYDDYGLVADVTSSAPGEAARARHFGYDAAWPGAPDEHLFASLAFADHDNALCSGDCRPAVWQAVHPAYGEPVASMNEHGVETVRTYDAHGRPVSTHTDGTSPIGITYAGRPDAFGGMNGLQATATSGSQQVFRTFDGRGAPLRTSFAGFDGQLINAFTRYDALGRVSGVSRPNAGPPNAWTTFDYDSLGRRVATHGPDGSETVAVHALFDTASTDPAGHASARHYDVDGRLVESVATLPPPPGCALCLKLDVRTSFGYTSTTQGAIATAIDDQGHVVTTHYDPLGRPIAQDDPSTGKTHVSYNGFGETKTTLRDATGDFETETYDDLGRRLTTTGSGGLTTFTWDVATHGVGRLARSMSPDQVKLEYRYDAQGRTVGIDQTDANSATLSLDLGYEPSSGRLASIDYPKAPGQAARLRAAYAYNGYGYLTSVSDATPGHAGTVWQQITARNADLALVEATRGIDAGIGGGAIVDHRDYDPLTGRLWTIRASHAGTDRLGVDYNYDADGLVEQRITTNESVQIDETFAYDALHRVTHATRNGMPLQNGLPFAVSVDEWYDTLGNRIDTTRNGQLVEHRSYGNNGAQPYALTERAVSDPKDPQAPASILKYQYDALGRLEQDPERAIGWTSFDLPASIIENGESWTFGYDANRARVTKSGPAGTITRFAGLYEKRETAAGNRHVFHIVGSDSAIADVIYTEGATPSQHGTTATAYALTDALGTTLAVADEHGTVAENDYYDLWGARTEADGAPLAQPTLFQSLVGAGFTGHDHDDDLALIDMQGRLYDPALGRFLSADPIVGAPALSQSWNSYSYVQNSPLNFTDPGGFDCSSSTTVSADGKSSSTLIGCHDDPEGNSGVETSVRWLQGVGTMMEDLTRIAKQRQALEEARGHIIAGARVRSADGTPLPRKNVDTARGVVTDNWGRTLYPLRAENPELNYTSHPAAKYVGKFQHKLFCGKECATASAPGTAVEAAQAPKQLSNAKIVRNAVSQAVAARSLIRWIGKVGVLIDEGVDGWVDRLTPDGMRMDDDEDERRIMQWVAERRALRAQARALAGQNYGRSEAAFVAAVARREQLREQVLTAERDLDGIDATTVATDLLARVYLDNKSDYERATADAAAKNVRAQVDFDWWQQLELRGDDD
ncbi:MAG: RHS repeat-associated core domain-containing protein [Rhodanobacteraceae bacterium]